MNRTNIILAVLLVVLSSFFVLAPNHEMVADQPSPPTSEQTFDQQPTLENFNEISNPTPQQFILLSPADQATNLQTNYRDDFAVKFYQDITHVGVYPEIDRKYFGNSNNHPNSPEAAERFFLGTGLSDGQSAAVKNIRNLLEQGDAQQKQAASTYFTQKLGASYIITAIGDDFNFIADPTNPQGGILKNAGVQVPVLLLRGNQQTRVETLKDTTKIFLGQKVAEVQGDLKLTTMSSDSGLLTFKQGEADVSVAAPLEGSAKIEARNDGSLQVTGKDVAGSLTKAGQTIGYTLFTGEIVFGADGNVAKADNAELDTPQVYVRGRFSNEGNQWKIYDHDGEHSKLAYKVINEDGSIPVFESQGQASPREAVTIFIDEVSPYSSYRPQQQGTGQEQPTPEQVQQAVAAPRAIPLQPGEGKAWITQQGDKIFIQVAGKVGFSYHYTAAGKPIGVDPTKAHYAGENQFSSFDYYKDGLVEQFQQVGRGTYEDAHFLSYTEDDGAILSKLPGQPEQADFLTARCLSRGSSQCATGTSFGVLTKKVAITSGEPQVVAGREVFTTVPTEANGFSINLQNTEQGVTPLPNKDSAGRLAEALGGNAEVRLAFRKDLFISSGTEQGENYFGFSGEGIGKFKHTDVGLQPADQTGYAGIDLRVRKITGNQIFLVDRQEQQQLERIVDILATREFNQLRSLPSESISPPITKLIQKEFGFDPNLMTDDFYAEHVVKGFQKSVGEQDSATTWARTVRGDLGLAETDLDNLGNCLTNDCADKINAALKRGDAAAQRIMTLQIRKREAEIAFAEAGIAAGEEREQDVRALREQIEKYKAAKASANHVYEQLLTRNQPPSGTIIHPVSGEPLREEEIAERIARREFDQDELTVLDTAWRMGRTAEQVQREIRNAVSRKNAEIASFDSAEERSFWDTKLQWQGKNWVSHQRKLDQFDSEIKQLEQQLRSEFSPAEVQELVGRVAHNPLAMAVVMQHLGSHDASAEALRQAEQLLEKTNIDSSNLKVEQVRARVRAGDDPYAIGNLIRTIPNEAARQEAEEYQRDQLVLLPLRHQRAAAQSQHMQKEDEVRLRNQLAEMGIGRAFAVLDVLNPYIAATTTAEATGLRQGRAELDQEFLENTKQRIALYDAALAQAQHITTMEDQELFLISLENNPEARRLGIGSELTILSQEARGQAVDDTLRAEAEVDEIRRQMDLNRDNPTTYNERLEELAHRHPQSGAALALEVAKYREEALASDQVITAAFDVLETAAGVGLADVVIAQGAKLAVRGTRLGLRGAITLAHQGAEVSTDFFRNIRRVDEIPVLQPRAAVGCAVAQFAGINVLGGGCARVVPPEVVPLQTARETLTRTRTDPHLPEMLQGAPTLELPVQLVPRAATTPRLTVLTPMQVDHLAGQLRTIIDTAESTEDLAILHAVLGSESAQAAFEQAGKADRLRELGEDLAVRQRWETEYVPGKRAAEIPGIDYSGNGLADDYMNAITQKDIVAQLLESTDEVNDASVIRQLNVHLNRPVPRYQEYLRSERGPLRNRILLDSNPKAVRRVNQLVDDYNARLTEKGFNQAEFKEFKQRFENLVRGDELARTTGTVTDFAAAPAGATQLLAKYRSIATDAIDSHNLLVLQKVIESDEATRFFAQAGKSDELSEVQELVRKQSAKLSPPPTGTPALSPREISLETLVSQADETAGIRAPESSIAPTHGQSRKVVGEEQITSAIEILKQPPPQRKKLADEWDPSLGPTPAEAVVPNLRKMYASLQEGEVLSIEEEFMAITIDSRGRKYLNAIDANGEVQRKLLVSTQREADQAKKWFDGPVYNLEYLVLERVILGVARTDTKVSINRIKEGLLTMALRDINRAPPASPETIASASTTALRQQQYHLGTVRKRLGELRQQTPSASEVDSALNTLERQIAGEDELIHAELIQRGRKITAEKLERNLDDVVAATAFQGKTTSGDIRRRTEDFVELTSRADQISNEDIGLITESYHQQLVTTGTVDDLRERKGLQRELEDLSLSRKAVSEENALLDYLARIDDGRFPPDAIPVFLGTDGLEYLEYAYRLIGDRPTVSHYISRLALATDDELIWSVSLIGEGASLEDLVRIGSGNIRLYEDVNEVVIDAAKQSTADDFDVVLQRLFDEQVMSHPQNRQQVIKLIARLRNDVDLTKPVILVDYAGRAHVQSFTLRKGVEWLSQAENWEKLTDAERQLLGNDPQSYVRADIQIHVGITAGESPDNILHRKGIRGVQEVNYGPTDLVETARSVTIDPTSLLGGTPRFVPTSASEQAATLARKLIIADEAKVWKAQRSATLPTQEAVSIAR